MKSRLDITLANLSDDLSWFYPVFFSTASDNEKLELLQERLRILYVSDLRAVAHLSLVVITDWLLKHQAFLVAAKWMGTDWIGAALVQALCELALSNPLFGLIKLIRVERDTVIGRAQAILAED